MNVALRVRDHEWTAEAFLATDQGEFGGLWRYELVDGRVVGQSAPAPDHGAIMAALAGALIVRVRGRRDGCRPETGSGAVPKGAQRPTARIPDVMIRCGEHPKVLFEVISPSELAHWRDRDRRRGDYQAVEGVLEIVELYQSEIACHVYRRQPNDTWSFEALDGMDAVLRLDSVKLEVPLSEIYEFADIAQEASEEPVGGSDVQASSGATPGVG
jgi:Uma2 family endonuclease